MKYTILVSVPTVFEVEASSEEDAKKKVEQQLINEGQIKPCSPITMQVAEEKKI